jgi:hypothetical protein
MIASRPQRRGYALMLVVIFVALFLAMLGMAWRPTASLLRTETVRAVQTRRDRGCMLAAVLGIHYLERCRANSTTPTTPQLYLVDGFSNYFTVTFTLESTNGSNKTWSIVATPTTTP